MKKFVTMFLILNLCFAASMPAFATAIESSTPAAPIQEERVARAEETLWYYREYNGQQQKRLWSITYGYWKTEWLPY